MFSDVIPACNSVYLAIAASYSGIKESLLVLILENVKTFSSQYFYWQMKAQQLFVEFTQNFYNHMIYINKYLFGF